MKKPVCLRTLAFLVVFLTMVFHSSLIRAQEKSLIRVTGSVTDPDLGRPLKAKVFYEKLPYYDDMGIVSTDEKDGVYELYMLEGVKYIINVKSDGYKAISEEIEIADSGIGIIEKNFRMEPDEAHERIILEDLIFDRGKAIISSVSHQELDEFGDWLKLRPTSIIQLEGHTDFQGDAVANMTLSEERVLAVRDYLSKKGIKKSRIRIKAFGGTRPLTRERTPEARSMNRRVEVRILQE